MRVDCTRARPGLSHQGKYYCENTAVEQQVGKGYVVLKLVQSLSNISSFLHPYFQTVEPIILIRKGSFNLNRIILSPRN